MQGDGSASRYAKTPGTESMVKTGGKLGDQLSLGTESRVSWNTSKLAATDRASTLPRVLL